MSNKEMNLAILEELKRIANEIFLNEIDIEPGTYTSSELAKEKSAKGDAIIIKYIRTNNESLLTRSVCVESFKCKFERSNIFNLVWRFEQLVGIKQKDKVRFVKVEIGKVDLSFSMEITKEMQSLCKCVGNDPQRAVQSYVFVDYKKGYIVATNGKYLQACKANISNLVGETETSVLINPKDFKQLSGACSVIVSAGKVTVTDKDGRIYCVETFGIKYPRWDLVVPRVSQNNYIKIKEPKEVLSFLKKKEGTFCMYAEKGHKVTIYHTNISSGLSSKIEVFSENEIPFAFSVMMDVKSFQTIAPKWDGGIFIDANYKPIVLTDKNENICFLLPSGIGINGFVKIEYDFDRFDMLSLLNYSKKEKRHTAMKQKLEWKYNNQDNAQSDPIKILLSSPAIDVESFSNEVKTIELQIGMDVLPNENQSLENILDIVPLPLPCMGVHNLFSIYARSLDTVIFALWFAVRLLVVSMCGTIRISFITVAYYRRKSSVRIRGVTKQVIYQSNG